MTPEAVDDPFDDCELAPDAILGTYTFEDVLFAVQKEGYAETSKPAS